MAIKRVTYEQYPIATFLDFQMPQMIAAAQARERSREHEIAMEDKRAERALNVAAWQANEERLTNLQDQFIDKGLKVGSEFQTSGYADLSQQILDDTKNKSQALLDTIQQGDRQISWMENELADLKAGSLFAERMEDKYGSSIAATENEAVKNYMLEGELQFDKETGKWTGTKELDDMLKGLTADQKANFTSDTFRKGFMQGRRTEAQAKEMYQIDQGLALTDLEIANAQYTKDISRLDDASTALQLSMKNYGNTYAGRLTLGDTSYGMIELLETESQIDVFDKFKDMVDNGEIAESVYEDVYNSISSLRTAAKSNDPYPERYFVEMASKAYDDHNAYIQKGIEAAANPDLKNDPKFIAEWESLQDKHISWNKVGLGDANITSLTKAKQLNTKFNQIQDAKLDFIMDEVAIPEADPRTVDPELEAELLNALNTQTENIIETEKASELMGESVLGVAGDAFTESGKDLINAFDNIVGGRLGKSGIEILTTPMDEVGIEHIARLLGNLPYVGGSVRSAAEYFDPSLKDKLSTLDIFQKNY